MTGFVRFARDNGLALGFGVLFLAALIGQAVAGHLEYNEQQITHGGAPLSMGQYLMSADFAVDVAENWQSEYLQFFLFVFVTVWLVQRGSPESKPVDEVGRESDQEQHLGQHADPDSPLWARAGGWRTAVFSRSLGLVMAGLFLLAWFAQFVAGRAAYNHEQAAHAQNTVTWGAYLVEPDFWNRTLQNWQSEFLAVGSMAVFAVYLRQRGSPESKPVGDPHATTAESG
jgi:hypothetical protein